MPITRIVRATDPSTSPEGAAKPIADPKQSETKPTSTDPPQPTRKLPTERIAFGKQLDILRAYGLASAGGTKAIHYSAAAEVVKMSATTVSLMNTFMMDNGFVQKSGNDFIPDKALIEFAQAYSWNPDTAARKLAPLIRRTWFGDRMVMRLQFRAMSLDDLVGDLAGQIGAGPQHSHTLGGTGRGGATLCLGGILINPALEARASTSSAATAILRAATGSPPA